MPCIILYQDMIWLHSRSEPAAPAGEVSKLLLDPTGFHALMTNSSGDTWYLNFQSGSACKGLKLPQLWFCIVLSSVCACVEHGQMQQDSCLAVCVSGTQAVRLPKLKGQVLESASWDVEATTTSTRDLLLGASLRNHTADGSV